MEILFTYAEEKHLRENLSSIIKKIKTQRSLS